MAIRAKFRCLFVSDQGSQGETVEFHAANGRKDTANGQWAQWTPSGKLTMHINNPAARGFFKPEKWYFLDIEETTEDAI